MTTKAQLERRVKAYRHMLVEVCQELSGCKQDPSCFLLLCNLDELLKQEEKADRKRKR